MQKTNENTPPAAAGTLIYESSFGAGDDLWAPRGEGARVFHTTEGTLRTEGRNRDWDTPGRDFALTAGVRYRLSVEVYQDGADSAEFGIFAEEWFGGTPGWKLTARGTAEKGQWTEIAGDYTPDGDYDRLVLGVGTRGAGQLSFEIRRFRVEAPDGVPEKRAGADARQEAAADVTGYPSLKEAYEGLFDFGAAASLWNFRSPVLQQLMIRQFSILTPENELKPERVLDREESARRVKEDETAVAVRFDSARVLLDFAKANGLKVHGHTLAWHNQTPEWFFHEGYDSAAPMAGRETMLGRMENYIREVLTWTGENYPGLIVSWDVVNEAIADDTCELRDSKWKATVGEDFVNRAFEYARKYAPAGTLLYYNDYNTYVPEKLEGILRLLDRLIPEGNIDGYGFQMHLALRFPPLALIRAAVDRIAALGLRLRVSELDITIDSAKRTEELDEKQKDMYREVMKVFVSVREQMEAVQVWGLADRYSWRRDHFPLPLDGNLQPKPAFHGILEAVGLDN